ncbi:hypothetical protein [[Muricauda] lutisoli]|uniref:Uncharacterized protein n=1 Tax=[Muricauda] lutisoli TaxID=2816035 RepID=A0ABS3EV85_9FLAO|nr:hypothetical protein [[Muricauda] lutisoli]MBO0330085.1 hypothetical protein [[Muricauda] lutisoli]
MTKEESRLASIESKTSQLISQTGVVFSFLSLFVPFIIEDILELSLYLKIPFVIILILSYVFYILAIHNSLSNYNIKKYPYCDNAPTTIIKNQKKKEREFIQIEIKDTLYCLNTNIGLTNVKASNLLRGYHFFKFGIITTTILVVFLCSSFLFMKSNKTIRQGGSVKVENISEVNSLHFDLDINTDKKNDTISGGKIP